VTRLFALTCAAAIFLSMGWAPPLVVDSKSETSFESARDAGAPAGHANAVFLDEKDSEDNDDEEKQVASAEALKRQRVFAALNHVFFEDGISALKRIDSPRSSRGPPLG
jgi:hypothetical protein